MIYQEITTYCPFHDCEVTRLSTCLERGGPEFFCLIPRDRLKTKRWRDLRDEALKQMDLAMQLGCEPGQVLITLDA